MDLILFQPGDTSWYPKISNDSANGGSLISNGANWITKEKLKLGPCIELVSIDQGMIEHVTTDISHSAHTSGWPVISDLTCVKYVDKTSVIFYDWCLRAKLLGDKANPSYIYILRNSGDQCTSIMTLMLRDAIISEIQLLSHPDDMPTEQFKLNFTEILWSYSAQKEQVNCPVIAGWSLAQNKPLTEFT